MEETQINILDYAQPVATTGGGAEKADWWKLPLIAAALVVTLLAIILYTARDVLAQRLADAGWVLYVMPGCGACAKQEEILGYYGYLIPHYPFTGKGQYLGDPTKMPPPVDYKAITGFPTWVNVKGTPPLKQVVGVQNEIALAKMLGL